MRRSHSVQMFWPVGSPPVLGGLGEFTGALTWRVVLDCCCCCCCWW